MRARQLPERTPRVVAKDLDGAATRLAEALEDLDGRRLTGPVGPDEREDLPAPNLKVDAANGLPVAVTLLQTADPDHHLALVRDAGTGHGDGGVE